MGISWLNLRINKKTTEDIVSIDQAKWNTKTYIILKNGKMEMGLNKSLEITISQM